MNRRKLFDEVLQSSEEPWRYVMAMLALTMLGAGEYSVDRWLRENAQRRPTGFTEAAAP